MFNRILTVLVLLVLADSIATAQNYRAEGDVLIEFFGRDGAKQQQVRYPFTIERSNATWRVFVVQPSGISLSLFSDGKSTARIVAETTIGGVVPADVRFGSIPIASYYEQVPWFAFFAVDVLRTNLSLPAPWEVPAGSPEAHVYRVQPVTDPATGLLSTAEFVADPLRLASAHGSEYLNHETTSSESRKRFESKLLIREGIIGGRFQLLETTNVAAVDLPSRFVFENYFVLRGEQSDPKLARRFTGSVSNINVGSIVPSAPGRAMFGVNDYRYSAHSEGVYSIAYQTTNLLESYPNTNRTSQLQTKVANMPIFPIRTSYVIISVILCLIGFFVGLWLLSPHRRS